ncbi:phosphoribosylaminoimidazole carboxylase [Myxozyma melibiosi]|uniref:Phosphoribosylaminoimidazole carboxylase n=1 Tax=Myxozyma melibiosi TaxID=54550 RepID=A0ABR1F467_9ASCO
MDRQVVGILGGGQLGRMLVEAASRLDVKTLILDAENAPAKQIRASDEHVTGSFADAAAVRELAEKVDVLTIEIEHVDTTVLFELEKEKGEKLQIHPSPATIKLIQDKFLQKEFLLKNGVAAAECESVESTEVALEKVGEKYGYPYMLKSRTQAYDGRGNFVVSSKDDIPEALKTLHSRPLYAEKWCPFTKELAVMVLRERDGSVSSYPTVETVQKDNICHLVYAPARVPDSVQLKAKVLAERAVSLFSGAGIYGVEMFLLENGEILLNEIAPRPHNSGHYTIDGCATSQFEAHMRAILGLPIPKSKTGFALSTPYTSAIMLNVLGGAEPDSELEICRRALTTKGATVHLYGKTTRPGRKMGHINIVAGSMDECETRLAQIQTGESSSSSSSDEQKEKPLVGIIMGSDSDLPVMATGARILQQFDVPFEVTITSAHRTPFRMTKYATEAAARGIKTIIAGAGGAAHLPGMVAAMTTLPVIGVPVRGSTLDGVDSLYSIVQMPRGIPVATVAINNATNAALLAVRNLAAFMPKYQLKLEEYYASIEKEVLDKADRLETIGFESYLSK